MCFQIPKIWHIFKCFAMSFHPAQTCNFWRVQRLPHFPVAPNFFERSNYWDKTGYHSCHQFTVNLYSSCSRISLWTTLQVPNFRFVSIRLNIPSKDFFSDRTGSGQDRIIWLMVSRQAKFENNLIESINTKTKRYKFNEQVS